MTSGHKVTCPRHCSSRKGTVFFKEMAERTVSSATLLFKTCYGKTVITSVLGIRFFSLSGMNQSQFSLACLSLVLLPRKVTWH